MNSAHTVQFFDGPETVGPDVAAFFLDGIKADEYLVLVARPAHVQAIGVALASHGISLSDLVESGRLTLLDAAVTLRHLMHGGRPDAAAFERVLAAPVRQLIARTSGNIRVYGELVDMLACADDVRGSTELEDLWNTFSAHTPIRLHCGYSAANFADARMGRSMLSICRRHGHVHRNDQDLLANWLLAQHA